MPDDAPAPDDADAPERDPWADDPWKDDPWKNDAWARDRWKEADWGTPAVPPGEAEAPKRKPGLAGWNASMMEAGPYLGLGLQSAFAMAFFVGLGYLVDRGLGSRPWGMIVGAVLGIVAVITLLVRLANQANAAARERRKQAGKRS